jgi:hypothetical protein
MRSRCAADLHLCGFSHRHRSLLGAHWAPVHVSSADPPTRRTELHHGRRHLPLTRAARRQRATLDAAAAECPGAANLVHRRYLPGPRQTAPASLPSTTPFGCAVGMRHQVRRRAPSRRVSAAQYPRQHQGGKRRGRGGKTPKRVYPCGSCDGWHLTSKPLSRRRVVTAMFAAAPRRKNVVSMLDQPCAVLADNCPFDVTDLRSCRCDEVRQLPMCGRIRAATDAVAPRLYVAGPIRCTDQLRCRGRWRGRCIGPPA